MKIINIYEYIREDGGVTVSPFKPEVEYTEMYRLVADYNKMLTNGIEIVYSIDIETIDGWYEIEAPEVIDDSEEATEEDYQNALKELGVKFND